MGISWQQPTLDRKKQCQKGTFPLCPPVSVQLADLWGSKSNAKFLWFWFGFGFVLGSFFFIWRILVLFGLKDCPENSWGPDVTGERNSDCKWSLESNKICQHNVHNFSSKKHSETDKMYVPDAVSWSLLVQPKCYIIFASSFLFLSLGLQNIVSEILDISAQKRCSFQSLLF